MDVFKYPEQRVLVIGCTPGRSYERPHNFRLAARA